MKVIIAGSRTFSDYNKLKITMNTLNSNKKITKVISGDAAGADKLGEKWSNENNIPVIIMKAKWQEHGKSAGYKRNLEMAEKADAVVAFWDGKSKGTKHMIDIANDKKLLLRVVNI